MSATKQKVKEGKTKTNAKVITKAKIVLANPNKPKVPSLDDRDFANLQELLAAAIKESDQNGKVYATATNINIGLESTLRSINNCKAGCVFLSANIKPKYVLGLIARNAEVKDPQVPVYVQKELENMTKKIFNVRALALTLPKNSISLNDELQLWVDKHLRSKLTELTSVQLVSKIIKPVNIIQNAVPQNSKLKPSTLEKKTEINDSEQAKAWSTDYISFSNDKSMDVDEVTSIDDHEKLQDALTLLVNKVKVSNLENTNITPAKESQEEFKTSSADNTDEDDDFLDNYAPLTLQKILPNPNRKPRKKK